MRLGSRIKNFIFFVVLAVVLLPLTFSKKNHYFSVCAIFRNEARFLKEWIDYHRSVGVDHFYLLNNLSNDNFREVLEPYIREGVVELFDWPYQGRNLKEWNRIQCRAYTKILKQCESYWVALIDTDEFIIPAMGKVTDFLKKNEHHAGIGINWQLYGTSHVKHADRVMESLTKKAPKDYPQNRFVKSIVQPKYVRKIRQPHYCKFKKPYRTVDEHGVPFRTSLTAQVSTDHLWINHYTYRDEEFFYGEKRRRFLDWFPGGTPPEPNEALNID